MPTPHARDNCDGLSGLDRLERTATLLLGDAAPGPAAPLFPDLDSLRERRKIAHVILRIEQTFKSRPKRRRIRPSHAALVGKFVLVGFRDPSNGGLAMHRGRVTRVTAARGSSVYRFPNNVSSSVKCLVTYEDGDSEHMTPADVERQLVR